MEDTARGSEAATADAGGARPSLGRIALAVGLAAFGVFYMMLAMGGGSFVHECRTIVCGQLHQAIFAAIAGVASFVSAFRIFEGKPVAKIIFLGTLPIFVVHVLLVMTDPDEALFFPLSTLPPPLISGARLVLGTRRRN